MKHLLALLFIFPQLAFASGSDAALRAGLLAASAGALVTGTQHAIYESLVRQELRGWSNKETGTTTILESSCSINAELHLLGDHRENFLLLGISNPTKSSVIVKYSEIEFVINKESSRFPGWRIQPSDRDIKTGWWELNYVPFPSKQEFSKYETIGVKIPLYIQETNSSCVLTAQFSKFKKILRDEISYSIFDIIFEGGPSLFQLGPTKKLGRPESYFGIAFNAFGSANHGAGMTLIKENSFEGSSSTRIQQTFSRGENYSASSTIFALNYVYRHFFSHHLTLTYEPALGWQSIYDSHEKNSKDNGQKEMRSDFIFMQKLFLNWTFAQVPTPGVYRYIDFFTGLGIVHIWVPSSSIGGENLDGNRFGALLRFGMGF